MAVTYKKAGVDIEAGDALVDWLTKNPGKSKQKKDKDPRVVSGIGGFAALYRSRFPKMKSPCLVTCTDGVGTKVLLASHFKDWTTVGQDLVGMCVNDLICTGGQPLLFLDYYACGSLNLRQAKQFLAGVQKACDDSSCVLIGGETAEMPGVYQKDHFDCAGFAVGVVDESKVLGAHKVKAGDRIVGFASSGFHSNGYSLLRKVFGKDLKKWRKTLLEPTRLYVSFYQEMQRAKIQLRALAHITGGGLDNIGRVLPKELQANLRAWPLPEPFLEVKRRTMMKWHELAITLNCGIGLVAIVKPEDHKRLVQLAKKQKLQAFDLGSVQKRLKKNKTWQMDFADWEASL